MEETFLLLSGACGLLGVTVCWRYWFGWWGVVGRDMESMMRLSIITVWPELAAGDCERDEVGLCCCCPPCKVVPGEFFLNLPLCLPVCLNFPWSSEKLEFKLVIVWLWGLDSLRRFGVGGFVGRGSGVWMVAGMWSSGFSSNVDWRKADFRWLKASEVVLDLSFSWREVLWVSSERGLEDEGCFIVGILASLYSWISSAIIWSDGDEGDIAWFAKKSDNPDLTGAGGRGGSSCGLVIFVNLGFLSPPLPFEKLGVLLSDLCVLSVFCLLDPNKLKPLVFVSCFTDLTSTASLSIVSSVFACSWLLICRLGSILFESSKDSDVGILLDLSCDLDLCLFELKILLLSHFFVEVRKALLLSNVSSCGKNLILKGLNALVKNCNCLKLKGHYY